jgi:2',3'-cyclic-nucleotide 2'-phosphodiesterase/3'-nucleotidase/5'-nucleotidase
VPRGALASGRADGGRSSLELVSFDEQNRFDASDRDGQVRLRHWPVLGGYMPDGIEALRRDGVDYFVTANEGDTRGYDARRLADVELDPERFPNAAALQSRHALGRLEVSILDGDLDADGDLDEIHAFGARSLSVWDAAGQLVFDTGSLLEDVTALALSTGFNSNNDANGSFDTRSDNKGPEPEGLDVGEIDGRFYVFLGLERVGGIVVLDVTDPRHTSFVEYVNPRNFEGDAARGGARDLGPEGVEFVPAGESPTGRGLLLVANEVSGTTTAYHVNL